MTAPFPAAHKQQEATRSRPTFSPITSKIWVFEKIKEIIQLT